MRFKNEVFEDEETKEKYMTEKSFIINRVMSMYLDCVIPANMMNLNYHIDGKLKFDFYLNTIRGYKRPFNYASKIKYDDLDIIKEYYGISNAKAKEYHNILTPEQIEEIKHRLNKGGVNKKTRVE